MRHIGCRPDRLTATAVNGVEIDADVACGLGVAAAHVIEGVVVDDWKLASRG